MEIITCSCGFSCNATQKFCSECGALLKNVIVNNASNISSFSEQKSEPINIYPDDKGLKLLLDCCEKVGPLVTGDRYKETVLYYDEKNNCYQVHNYASQGYGSSTHEGYYTTKEHADRVMQSVNVDAILKENNSIAQVCGGSRIIKFRNANDEMIRVEYSSVEVYSAVAVILGLLNEAIKNENRIIPEYAKTWKQIAVYSSGISMDSCYNYYIERNEQGSVRVKGFCFIASVRHELTNWLELIDEEKVELDKIPLGLMLSNRITDKNPHSLNRCFLMMSDFNSCSCTITYGDDKTDTKIPDIDMINSLDSLLKKVFSRKTV